MEKPSTIMERLPIVPWARPPRPFLKWAGGKTQLLETLESYFPKKFKTYYEPFLGGGAAFFYLVERRPRFDAVLSDINEELITAYRIVKDRVSDLIALLKKHKEEYEISPEKYYYKVREQEPLEDVEKAARLIFLNKTCYNGLYRVNREGKFNVPFGRYKNPRICDEENLRTVSQVLHWSDAKILDADYQKATKNAEKSDFIYFDPPYQPVSATANFTGYTNSGFTKQEQERLGRWFRKLDARGCQIILSNSDTPEVREIYGGHHYRFEVVKALRAISCKGNLRTGHTELIISNNNQAN
jgi:DNA adenine methylase